jgi:hypothetical protein
MLDEKEIIELAKKYRLPDVDKYSHVNYEVYIGGSFMDRNIATLQFIKYDDGSEIAWSYCRTFVSFMDEYSEELHQSIIDKQIEIWKSIYEVVNKLRNE